MTDPSAPGPEARGPTATQGPQPVPEIHPGLCVHERVVDGACCACVDACPHDAWTIDDEGIGILEAACDGCAICGAVCPEDAIRFERAALALSPFRHDCALAACEIVLGSGGNGVLPCLHAVGLDELANLHERGIRRLFVSRGNCSECSRGRDLRFDDAVRDLRRLLHARGLEDLSVIEMSPRPWLEKRDDLSRHTRRSLFTALRPRQASTAGGNVERLPAAIRLDKREKAARLNPLLPAIDPQRCEACDACIRICPHEVVTRVQGDEGHASYVLDPPLCTGCGLCVDVCEAEAFSLHHWIEGAPEPIPLDLEQCASCGNLFWIVNGRGTEDQLCRICSTTGHNRSLFQVI